MTTPLSSSAEFHPQEENEEGGARFGGFWIPAASIFLRTSHSVAFVNLRPIVPGHVLVIPRRVVPHLHLLPPDEYDDLWRTVRTVQSLLAQRYRDAPDANVAVQDGPGAGQSVPHVHVHLLPRRGAGDFSRHDDEVHDALERWAPRDQASSTPLHVPADEDRRDRSEAEMAAEAEEYRHLLLSLDLLLQE
jgi:bis(5'-adenosyl)-triphosphatase